MKAKKKSIVTKFYNFGITCILLYGHHFKLVYFFPQNYDRLPNSILLFMKTVLQ